ncbi:demethylmenaquinone methyltransferase/2-methoxy-6-polyprenyl-1,4-benzoquinol methylase [Halalkaliarchaeum desulfuricum]|uniref:Demethylmenaquinone methyltransferase/2-methoxy-6-polyprenyl-1,4-benzoquinol methylase n=1 Tax=Halalkaliarchaeum desulfuricum TaxID=2055893 RepID=A0A343TKH8_9EURY|nr:methyltransferase domain-containing protein [Halalkaliarchaeum desulfuricum]AUX09600.1 demethylmenaquinone methyltransferase/2-methoxy-6-polyprenyl-1,4-benzoquinol methylase [Halalkaliarchaeum desulfuricum]
MFGPGDVRFFDFASYVYDAVMPPANVEDLSAGLALADRPIDRVLDVGGGTGRAIAPIRGPERVVADASGGMLRRITDLDIQAVRSDARRLPFRDAAFDAAVLVDALHHVPDRPAVLREVRRVLAPGGAFVIRDFDPSHPLGRLLVAAEHAVGMHSRFYTPEEIAGELSAAGFDPSVLATGFGYTVVGVVPEDGGGDGHSGRGGDGGDT